MTHYVCTGECKGVSDHPQNCGAEACSMHDKPLVPCDCEDGKHKGFWQDKEKASE